MEHCSSWQELGKYQELFAYRIAQLKVWAREEANIAIRIKDAYRDSRLHGSFGEKLGYGASCSMHKLSLAEDFFVEDLRDLEILHDKWDELGGAPRIKNDMGHFSFKFQSYW